MWKLQNQTLMISLYFYVNIPTVEMEIRNEYVCTKETALQVILKFMCYDECPVCFEDLPDCVEWEEL